MCKHKLTFALLLLSFLFHPSLGQRSKFPVAPNLYDAQGRRTGHWTILYDTTFSREVTDPDSAVYYRLIKFEAGKPAGKVRDFYRSGQKQWDGFLISLTPDVPDGEVHYYYPNGQVSHTLTYKNGIQNGLHQEFTRDGILTVEGTMKNDSTHGLFRYYAEEGWLQEEVTYRAGKKHGPYVLYYSNGTVNKRGTYVNDLLEGLFEVFYENGALAKRIIYSQDKQHGPYVHYYEDGTVNQKGAMDMDRPIGQWETYYPDGTLEAYGPRDLNGRQRDWVFNYENGKKSQEGTYRNDLAEGDWKNYYDNGRLKSTGPMLADVKEGYWVFYDENGFLDVEAHYHQDTLNGPYKSYFPGNNQVELEGTFRMKRKDGEWKYYYPNGTIRQREFFHNGIYEDTIVYYYETGLIKEKSPQRNNLNHGEVTSWHPNGKIKSQGTNVQDKREGEWRWYYDNGQTDAIIPYLNGQLHGHYEKYHANGTRAKELNYKQGLLEGPARYWASNGKLHMTGSYVHDRMEGHWIYYDTLNGLKDWEADYQKGKINGTLVEYDNGKKSGTETYIEGFHVAVYSIRDSIEHLLGRNDLQTAESCIRWMEQVIKQKKLGSTIQSAEPDRMRALLYGGRRNYQEALRFNTLYLKKCLQFGADTTFQYQAGLNERAIIFNKLQQYDSALAITNQQLVTLKKQHHQQGYLLTLINKAKLLHTLHTGDEAEQLLADEIQRQKKLNGVESYYYWYIRQGLGEYYDYISENEKATNYLQTMLDSLLLLKKPSGQVQEVFIQAGLKLANRYPTLGKRREAIHTYQVILQYMKENNINDINATLECMNLSALNYRNLGKLDSAWALYQEEGRLLEAINATNSLSYAELLHGKAHVMYANQQYDEAIGYWTEGIKIIKDLDQRESNLYANMLTGFVGVNQQKRNYAEAERYLKEIIEIKSAVNGPTHPFTIDLIIDLGDNYVDWGKLEEANALLSPLEKTIAATEGTASYNYARCKYTLAGMYYEMFNYQEAVKQNDVAIQIHRQAPELDIDQYIYALQNQVRNYRLLAQYPEANKVSLEQLDVIEKYYGRESGMYLNAMADRARLFAVQGFYADATRQFLENMAGYKKLYGEDNPQYINSVRSVGKVYLDQGEYEKAYGYYKQFRQLSLTHFGEGSPEYLDATSRLGQITDNLNRYTEAESYRRQCVTLAKNLYGTAHEDYAFYLKELGLFYKAQGRLAEAETQLTQAVMILEKTDARNNGTLYGRYLRELAEVKLIRDKNQEAEALYLRAIALVQDTENQLAEYAETSLSYASFLSVMGRYRDSGNTYRQIMDELQKAGQTKSPYYFEATLGLISNFRSQRNYTMADQEGKTFLALLEEESSNDSYWMLELHNILGLNCIDLGLFDEAETHFQYRLDQYKLMGADYYANDFISRHNLSNPKMEKGEYAEAERLLLEAAAIRKRLKLNMDARNEALYKDNLAILYQAWGKMAKAEPIWKEVTASLLQYTRENFYFMSDEEKAQFWNDIKADFEYFNTFAVQRSKENPAILGDMYNNQLATKAILLSASNKIKARIFGSGDPAMKEAYYNWVETREKLAQLFTLSEAELKTRKAELDSLQQVATRLEKDLNISAEDLDKDRGGKNQVTWRDVQKLLAPTEAAVEIIRYRYFDKHVRDSVLYAALVLTAETKTTPRLVVLPNGNQLEGRNLRFYKNAIASKMDDRLSYPAYWAPIEALLQGKTRVYLSLDGVYNEINLNTLLNDQGNFMVESKNLTIVSNTKDLLALKSRKALRHQNSTATLFGYPKYFLGKDRIREKARQPNREVDVYKLDDTDATGISELPGTKTEVEQVKNILTKHQWNAVDFTNEEATESALKAITYPGILHIATHGYFVDEHASSTFNLGLDTEYARQNPLLRSGLLLSGASNFIQNNVRLEDENGILTAYEAGNLNLDNTDLVILSACETGKGEVQNGEGVYGLQRAFQTAGARAIIMSLWKVDDAATQELMRSFYENWMDGAAKPEAFRQAQLQLKEKFSHPYYWGAFVMMGE